MSTSQRLDVQNAQRFAYEMLANDTRNGKKNPFFVNPKNITVPAKFIQEQQLTTAARTYTFDFSSNAPQATAALNNQNLPKTAIAAVYGIQVLLGEGSTVARRVYRSFGPAGDDNVVYNGKTSWKLEEATFVDFIDNLDYRKVDGTNFDLDDGLVLINPIRIISGELGTNQITLSLPDTSALVFTANLYISVRLHVVFGQNRA